MSADPVRGLLAQRAERYMEWLTEACSIRSLAGDPDGLVAMASWVQSRLEEQGAIVDRLTCEGAPDVLLGRLGEGARTLVIYDHYDVQPVDPIDEWSSNPFEPEVRNGIFYARGAADNKGDLVARIAGVEVFRDVYGELPVSAKFLIEGEEETGSRSMREIVRRHADELRADGCIWEGQGIDHAGRPELVFGAKGLAYVELTCHGLKDDQHSSLAAIAPSPAWRLIEALSTLRSPDGEVLIDGFNDDLVEPDEDTIRMLEELPFDEETERERLGTDSFVGGTTGLDLVRRYYFSPTCNIAGIVTGFTTPGTSKTVLPKEARAKLDMRLVPDQSPHDIVGKLRRHLDVRGFDDVKITTYSMEHPVRSKPNSLVGRAAVRACAGVFESSSALAPMMIATGPMYHIAKTLGIPTVSPAGVHRPDSNIHAPNENCRIDDFLKIVEYTVAWLKSFAEIDA